MNLDRIIAVRNDKTIFRDGEQCVKLFNANYSKSEILNEARNHALLEESGLNVPAFYAVEQINGKWAIVSEYIEGKTLEQLIEEHPEKREAYMDLFVDLQLAVHAKRGRLLNRLKDRLARRIDGTDLHATLRWYLFSRMEEAPNREQICHGDFMLSNVIVKQDGTPYIIDWSHAALGNAEADIALTYLLLWMQGKIDQAAMYLERICKKAGVGQQDVLAWMPIVAASQYAKCSEKEREFLLSWINDINRK